MLVQPLEDLDDAIHDVVLQGVDHVQSSARLEIAFRLDIDVVEMTDGVKKLPVCVHYCKRVGNKSGQHHTQSFYTPLPPRDIPLIPILGTFIASHGSRGGIYAPDLISALCARAAKLVVTAVEDGILFRLTIGAYECESLATDDAVQHILVRT